MCNHARYPYSLALSQGPILSCSCCGMSALGTWLPLDSQILFSSCVCSYGVKSLWVPLGQTHHSHDKCSQAFPLCFCLRSKTGQHSKWNKARGIGIYPGGQSVTEHSMYCTLHTANFGSCHHGNMLLRHMEGLGVHWSVNEDRDNGCQVCYFTHSHKPQAVCACEKYSMMSQWCHFMVKANGHWLYYVV